MNRFVAGVSVLTLGVALAAVPGPALAQYPPVPYCPPTQQQTYPPPPYYNQDHQLVPYYKPVLVSPDYYWGVYNHFAQANTNALLEQNGDLIRTVLAGQLGQLHQAGISTHPALAGPVRGGGRLLTPVFKDRPAKAAALGGGDGEVGLYLRDACVRCHSASRAGGGIDLSVPDAVPAEARKLSFDAILDGTMPKGGTKATREQIALVYKWSRTPAAR